MKAMLQASPSKCKRERKSRSCVRLVGWLKFRIGKSSKPWIRVRLEEFCSLSGVTMKTARRCLNKIREDEESEIVLRTCHEQRRWILLASTTKRLDGLKRSEPFEEENGKKRIIKDKKSGRRITQEQLVLNDEPLMWNAEPNNTQNSKSDCVEQEPELSDPNQMELPIHRQNTNTQTKFVRTSRSNDEVLQNAWANFLGSSTNKGVRVRDISPCVVEGGFSQRENKDKHRKTEFGEKSRKKLAFWLTRNEIEPLHYDNCKIGCDRPIAWQFVKDSLDDGYDRKDIVRCWDDALHDCHAMAVDTDPTAPAGSWRASSTSHRARKLLSGCRKSFFADKKQTQIVSPWNS